MNNAQKTIDISYNSEGINVYFQFDNFTAESELFTYKTYRVLRDSVITKEMTKEERDKITDDIENFIINEQDIIIKKTNEKLKNISTKYLELVNGVIQEALAENESSINEYMKKYK